MLFSRKLCFFCPGKIARKYTKCKLKETYIRKFLKYSKSENFLNELVSGSKYKDFENLAKPDEITENLNYRT
jgi:hypothetical protein